MSMSDKDFETVLVAKKLKELDDITADDIKEVAGSRITEARCMKIIDRVKARRDRLIKPLMENAAKRDLEV